MPTRWKTDDIWLRRQINMPEGNYSNLQFYVHHDEDVEICVNGILAAIESGFTSGYFPLENQPRTKTQLNPGATIIIAIHCRPTGAGKTLILDSPMWWKHNPLKKPG